MKSLDKHYQKYEHYMRKVNKWPCPDKINFEICQRRRLRVGSRDVPFDEDVECDRCGARGVYDFMGDNLCSACAKEAMPLEACNRCGHNVCICGL